MGNALNISHQTLFLVMKKTKCIKRHSSAVKPKLQEDNMLHRVEHCMMHVGDNGMFKCMKHILHSDEKWFNMTRVKQIYYLSEDEEPPERQVAHKSHIGKVMFLCVVGCPQYYYPNDEDGGDGAEQQFFDGKIGIWPIGEMVPAARSSVNRPRGTPVWKDGKLTRELYSNMVQDLVLPAIKERFPCHAHDVILLQQDNAPAHSLQNDAAIQAKIESLDINVKLFNQPANSPDLNINDLGFFAALQTKQLKTPTTTPTQLIAAVATCYEEYSSDKIRDNYLTLQGCMNCILDLGGGNGYKIPHMGKQALARQGLLPEVLPVTASALLWLNDEDTDEENVE